MRAISKGAEPATLITHRSTQHGSYGNYSSADKQELREALVKEQRGLCCYCMDALVASASSMKIEHWQCQETYPDRQLDYSNLLGACLGGEGLPGHKQHCDARKGMKDVKFNPSDPNHKIEQRIYYQLDGTIASTDVDFNTQLNDVLGLNLPALKERRKAVIDGLAGWFREYRKKHHRRPDASTFARLRSKRVLSTGNLLPFVGVAIFWIDSKKSEP